MLVLPLTKNSSIPVNFLKIKSSSLCPNNSSTSSFIPSQKSANFLNKPTESCSFKPWQAVSIAENQTTLVRSTLVKMDSNTIFNLEDFRPFQKVGNDKRILDPGKKLNLGEGILHKCKFHGKLCTCYFSYAQFDDLLIDVIKCCYKL